MKKNKKIKFFLVGFFSILSVLVIGGVFGYFFQNKTFGAVQKPEIFISGKDYFGKGGLISLALTDDPSIIIGGYNISGDATVNIYRVNTEDILKGLLHNEENNQISSKINFDKLEKISTFSQYIESGYDNKSQVNLPLDGSGEWLVDVSLQGMHANAYIIRSDIGALVKEGDGEMIFWVQSFSNKRSLSGADVIVYNLKDEIKKRYEVQSDSEGIAKTPISENDDVAIIRKDGDISLIPINLRYINVGYSYKNFVEKNVGTKAFIFTDRPLYAPSNKVYFKSIMREDDDARYSITSGDVFVEIYTGWGKNKEVVYGSKYPISPEGTVSGEFDLPEDVKTGTYVLEIRENESVSSEDNYYSSYISQARFDVQYYQKPEYGIDLSIEKDELISGDKLNFFVDGNYFSGQPLSGREVNYKIYSSDFYDYSYYKSTASYNLSDDYRYGYHSSDEIMKGSAILDANGRASINVDAVIPDGKNRKSKIFSIEAQIKDDSGNESFERKNVLVHSGEFSIYRDRGVYGAKSNQEISFEVVTMPSVTNNKLEGEITRVWWEKYKKDDQKYYSYNKKEESMGTVQAITGENGRAEIKFTPTKEGSYNVSVMGIDNRGNKIYKTFNFWVSDSSGYYSGERDSSGLTVKASKEEYDPSEKIQLNIHSEIPDRDIFLSLERGRMNRYQVIHLDGNNSKVDIPIENTDIPNIFAYVGSFSDSKLESFQENVKISSESKKMNVSIIPDKAKYAPGETASFDIKTTDYKGSPISAELAVWTVDKALFELLNNSTGDIFKTFWSERYNDTQESNSLVGISIYSAEKGGGGGEQRAIFKDTAYWNPKVHTNSNGYAKISFQIPDNLTTWVLSAVGATEDTIVGQITNEIVATKDVIIRPVMPNILRNDDEIVISALAQNFTDSNQLFTASLEFDSGEVDEAIQNISIDSNSSRKISWKIHPSDEEKDEAHLKFSVIGNGDKFSDVVMRAIPLRKFGFWETKAQFDIDNPGYEIDLSDDVDLKKTEINLALSSTLLGSLPSAMNYLISYPYGCVEQTTSHFIPAIIARENQELFKESIADKDIKDIIATGIERLRDMQGFDGGWSWWGGNSDYFVSAYVAEYLMRAKNVGADVDVAMLDRAKKYFENEPNMSYIGDERYKADIIRSYALSFFGEKKLVENFNDNTSPDILAMAVMANIRNGFYDPSKNGRDKLVSIAKSEGEDMLFWEKGNVDRFGSIEASTGMALRALLSAGIDKETASKITHFLVDRRKTRYWVNTFATAQVIQSLVDFSKTEEIFFPQYSYEVQLDGIKIASGMFDKNKWQDEISIPAEKINSNSSVLAIVKNGEGQLYSQFFTKEFHLNSSAEPVDRGIKISRTYVNEKGNDYPIGVGDVVDVNLSIGGDFLDNDFVVIEDQLPTGLVPINMSFKNSQYYRESEKYNENVKSITENGIIFATKYANSSTRNYSYKARAVSEGSFLTPPAAVSLMYSPDMYGHSGVQKVNVVESSEKKSEALGSMGGIFTGEYALYQKILVIILAIISLGTAIFFYYRSKLKK
ncbi:MAG: MG2 domain-containing protein [Candidatus Moranbacteria bacterium]|jgi:uncharacterized protein YfaS (alpha-2-macroglobulin family)|nr:MG2 domain-containing protein [Candidatus Moranbacteria bacterium]